MTPLELHQLIDAWIEQTISTDQFERLEQTLLNSRDARLHYLDYMHLHGLLHYEAAMKGDALPAAVNEQFPQALPTFDVQTFDQAFQPAHSSVKSKTSHSEAEMLVNLYLDSNSTVEVQKNTSRLKRLGLIGAIAACLMAVAGVMAYRPQFALQTLAITPVETSTDQPVAQSENSSKQQTIPTQITQAQTPKPLPHIHLPGIENEAHTPLTETDQQVLVSKEQEAPSPIRRNIVSQIDTLLASYWKENGVSPSPAIDDAQWYRRLSLDLHGIPPATSQLLAFVESDDPLKRQKLVDQLLDKPAFTQRLVDQWTTLLVGRIPAEPVHRDKLAEYLTVSFHENKPWSEVVSDLITAQGDPAEVGPANYLAAHLNNQAVPATAITARLFLGQQLACVQCHAHPFYDQSQETFWSFNAFFEATKLVRSSNGRGSGWELVSQPTTEPTYYETRNGLMKVAYPQYQNHKIEPQNAVERREKLAEFLLSSQSHQLATAFVNRRWEELLGRGFTTPVDDIGPHNPPCHPELLQLLTEQFVSSNYDIRQLTRWIVLSDAYSRSSQLTEHNEIDHPEIGEMPLFSRVYPKPLSAEQVYDSLSAISGNPQALRSNSGYFDQRNNWVSQFIKTAGDDENCELGHFEGSLSQALSLMNGPLVNELLDPERNQHLEQIIQSRKPLSLQLREVCLLALSREPNDKEQALFRRLQKQSGTEKTSVIQDVLWAYLNSGEFITNY